MVRYYSRIRPLTDGMYPTYDDNKIEKIRNFDTSIGVFVNQGHRKMVLAGVFGYIEYEKPIPEKDAIKYRLMREF